MALWGWLVETWVGRIILLVVAFVLDGLYQPGLNILLYVCCAMYILYSLWMASVKTESKGLNVFYLYPLHPWLKGRIQKLIGIQTPDELCEMHVRSKTVEKMNPRKIVLSIRNDCKTIEECFMPDHTITVVSSMYADSFADIGFRVTENFKELKRIPDLSTLGQRMLSRNKKWETRVWERSTRAISNVVQ